MDDAQFEKLLKALEKPKQHEPRVVQEPVEVKHDYLDNLMRLGVALCTAAIIYVATQLQGLTTDVAVMKTQMNSFEKFTEEPRFTAQHNQAADQLLIAEIKQLLTDINNEIKENQNDITTNTKELNRRTNFMDTTESDLREIDKRVRTLERKMEIDE